ncbi:MULTISPECIES: response regulator [Streptomyces]|uniref:response regulator n=1 Tax=Streptomyces TaxID=1883 RepID=UPI00099FFDE0|nr:MULTISPECIES: response regulator transcription factor [Streptomyces]TFI23193.1 response regulator transcription factor [Streptomyces sp. 4R-3d]
MIRVLVADDQALLRGSLRLLVDAEPGLVAVGEAADGTEAVRLTAETRPDVVLMDVRMPGLDGIGATRLICAPPQTASDGGPRVLILTMFDLDEYVYGALRAGASGFLLKDAPPAELLAAIRVVAAGEALIAPAVTRRLIAEFARRPGPARRDSAGLDGVTDRERDVLELVARGLTNTEIARRLFVGLSTVKTHVSHLLTKFGARDRAQLVIVAYETGLVTPGIADPDRRVPDAGPRPPGRAVS